MLRSNEFSPRSLQNAYLLLVKPLIDLLLIEEPVHVGFVEHLLVGGGVALGYNQFVYQPAIEEQYERIAKINETIFVSFPRITFTIRLEGTQLLV